MASIAQVMGTVAIQPAAAPRTMSPRGVPSRAVPAMSGTLRAAGPPCADQDEDPGRDEKDFRRRVHQVDWADRPSGNIDDVNPGQPEGAGDRQDRRFGRVPPPPG